MGVKRLSITAAVALVMACAIAYGLLLLRRPPPPPPPSVEELPQSLVVYCMQDDDCGPESQKIEALTHEVLEKSFAKELRDGQLTWLVVNYELPNNKFIIKEYDIRKPCIVLADGRPGKNRAWKNLQPQAPKLLDDEKAYKNYMRSEIEKALKDGTTPDAR